MSTEFTKRSNLEALLREVPHVDEPPLDDGLYLSGVLAASKPGLIRIIHGAYCFTFDIADVRDVLQLSDQKDQRGFPMVRLKLQCPTKLLNVEPWTEFEQSTCGAPRPFAFASRPHPIWASPNFEFRRRERDFFRDFE